MVSEAISSKTGLPLIPYAKGYAVGNVMSMQVADGDVYTLKLPSPDYAIAVELTGLKKVKYATVPAGTSFIYASYLNARIDEPVSGHAYLDAKFKNGEVKLVPATQQEVDDAPAYTDSIRGLFSKLAEALGGGSNAWIKSAASAHSSMAFACQGSVARADARCLAFAPTPRRACSRSSRWRIPQSAKAAGAPDARQPCLRYPGWVYFNPSACEGGIISGEESTDPNRAVGSTHKAPLVMKSVETRRPLIVQSIGVLMLLFASNAVLALTTSPLPF